MGLFLGLDWPVAALPWPGEEEEVMAEPTLDPTSLLAGLMDMTEVGEVGGWGELRPQHSGELPRSAEEVRRSPASGEEERQEPGEEDSLPSSRSRPPMGRVRGPGSGGVGDWSSSCSSTGKDWWIQSL